MKSNLGYFNQRTDTICTNVLILMGDKGICISIILYFFEFSVSNSVSNLSTKCTDLIIIISL